MDVFDSLGRTLILIGLGIVVLGALLWLVGRAPFMGRLPGDFVFQSERVSCFFPLATSIIVSLALTIVLNLVARWFNR